MASANHHDSIFVEQARILEHAALPGAQHRLRVEAPRCARAARPGSFAHVQCHPLLPMRRPLSLLGADPVAGWVEFLYKVVGDGTRLLAARGRGEIVDSMGPIGNGFSCHRERPRRLLIGGGLGIPPVLFLAATLRTERSAEPPLVLLGSEVPFPFATVRAAGTMPGIPVGVDAALERLEQRGLPSRLASLQGYPGCHPGYVTELARHWLAELTPKARTEVELYACGPHGMLAATAALASEFEVRCQVCLEEYMACAVGGCAGCTVAIRTDQGVRMQRVCVDGPVFEAQQVVWSPVPAPIPIAKGFADKPGSTAA